MTPAEHSTDCHGFRLRPPFSDTRFTSVGTLAEIEATPPSRCERRFYFVPMYVDRSVAHLKRVVADKYPHADNVMYREPCGEGTAYWRGTYGMAWPVDLDPRDGPGFYAEVAHG